jgi:hypothetical protein
VKDFSSNKFFSREFPYWKSREAISPPEMKKSRGLYGTVVAGFGDVSTLKFN